LEYECLGAERIGAMESAPDETDACGGTASALKLHQSPGGVEEASSWQVRPPKPFFDTSHFAVIARLDRAIQ
jgi:hypothetical protein